MLRLCLHRAGRAWYGFRMTTNQPHATNTFVPRPKYDPAFAFRAPTIIIPTEPLCPKCHGFGFFDVRHDSLPTPDETCPTCDGAGRVAGVAATDLDRLAAQAVRDFLYVTTDGATQATKAEALAALTAAIATAVPV